MEATTPKEFFEVVLPKRFKSDKAAGMDAIFQTNVTGANGGNWTVTIKNQQLDVKTGIHPSPNVTVKMDEKDFLNLVNGKISAEKAFFSGKLHLKGNIALALKLRDAGLL